MSMRRTRTGGSIRSMLCGTALALAGCGPGGQMNDLQPPPGFSPPPVQVPKKLPLRADRLDFGSGFYDMERDLNGSWRWMGARGEVRVGRRVMAAGDNIARPYRLRIVGWYDNDHVQRPPTIRVSIGDRLVGTFSPEGQRFDQAWTVPADLARTAASVPVVIETDSVVHVGGDTRDLGLAIAIVDWQALPP